MGDVSTPKLMTGQKIAKFAERVRQNKARRFAETQPPRNCKPRVLQEPMVIFQPYKGVEVCLPSRPEMVVAYAEENASGKNHPGGVQRILPATFAFCLSSNIGIREALCVVYVVSSPLIAASSVSTFVKLRISPGRAIRPPWHLEGTESLIG